MNKAPPVQTHPNLKRQKKNRTPSPVDSRRKHRAKQPLFFMEDDRVIIKEKKIHHNTRITRIFRIFYFFVYVSFFSLKLFMGYHGQFSTWRDFGFFGQGGIKSGVITYKREGVWRR